MNVEPDKLFVYGIFLDKGWRKKFGMTNARYATVKDYCTYGGMIVTADHQPGKGLALTGLIVDIDPNFKIDRWGDGTSEPFWTALDALECGYKRIIVETTSGEKAYMYAGGDT